MNKYIHALLNTPPKEIPGKSWKVIRKKLTSLFDLGKNICLPSYSDYSAGNGESFESYFQIPSLSKLKENSQQIHDLTNHYLAHRFDLLGSGWFEVKHGARCKGIENNLYSNTSTIKIDSNGEWLTSLINKSNLNRSKKIWGLIDNDYIPIDWQLDFISGYRWNENTWYINIPFGHLPGVDIKVPWELARMQHLPYFAYAHSLAKENGSQLKNSQTYLHEFQNQILDFIATNPPRYGVNWYCAMDVAIRATNWLVAYDLLKSSGASFSKEFEKYFMASIYDHGVHIVNNLEWNKNCTSNHYLANISGLLFISSYLPNTNEINSWLAFSVRELISETKIQFNNDGTNYEGSTSYHRLSSEMVAYSTALILGLSEKRSRNLREFNSSSVNFPFRPNPSKINYYENTLDNQENPFPLWFVERLERMAIFTETITKPNGMILQIGDNDSGRLLKLFHSFLALPVSEVMQQYKNLINFQPIHNNTDYLLENHLDHSHLQSTINALFSDDSNNRSLDSIEHELITGVTGNRLFTSTVKKNDASHPSKVRVGSENILKNWIEKFETIPSKQKISHEIPIGKSSINNKFDLFAFPKFGLFIYKSFNFYLTIRCGMKPDNAPSGHYHNDQLSIELNIDGEDLIVDPGTYVYTPLPEKRNEYRSVKAHFAPRINGREPNHISNLLFRLEDRCKARCLYFGDRGFLGMHNGYGSPIYRMVLLNSSSITIHDYTEVDEEIFSESPLDSLNRIPFSPGYGIVQSK